MKTLHSRRDSVAQYEQFRVAKALARKRDQRRLARRQVSPEQLQTENAVFTRCAEFRILNLAETMAYFRRHSPRRG